jgi:hypothetical protein
MLRFVGVSLVLLGCLLLTTDGVRWDAVIVSFPSGGPLASGKHGFELSELVGFALVGIGVALIWPRRT